MDIYGNRPRRDAGNLRRIGTKRWTVLGGVGILVGAIAPFGASTAGADYPDYPHQVDPNPTPPWPGRYDDAGRWYDWSQQQQNSVETTPWNEIFSQSGCTLNDLQYIQAPADQANSSAPWWVPMTDAEFYFTCPQGVEPTAFQGSAAAEAAVARRNGHQHATLAAAPRGPQRTARLDAFALNGCEVVTDGFECGGVNLANQAFGVYQYLGPFAVTGYEAISDDGPGSPGCWPGSLVASSDATTLSFPQDVAVAAPISSSSTWDATFYGWSKDAYNDWGYNNWGDVCGYN